MFSKFPNDLSIALHNWVLGLDEPGLRFCQKMEWLICPPPLKRIAGPKATAVLQVKNDYYYKNT